MSPPHKITYEDRGEQRLTSYNFIGGGGHQMFTVGDQTGPSLAQGVGSCSLRGAQTGYLSFPIGGQEAHNPGSFPPHPLQSSNKIEWFPPTVRQLLWFISPGFSDKVGWSWGARCRSQVPRPDRVRWGLPLHIIVLRSLYSLAVLSSSRSSLKSLKKVQVLNAALQ